MARHLELGNHLDVPRRRVAQDLGVVRAGKEAAAPGPVHVGPGAERGGQVAVRIGRVAASRAHRCELGQARDLDAPALVVREMEVEDIDLVAGQQVERAQHHAFGMEIPGDVEHEAAVAEAGRVYHPNRRQDKTGPRRGRGQQAAQRLEAVEDTGRRNAHDPYPLGGIHHERVRLGRGLACHGTHL